MFCDLVGSTALGARLDPEDLREVIAAYHRRVTGEIMRFGGFVARYMGDGVLVYFGYPTAHENDAERAVRAGLAVIESISRVGSVAGPPGTLATRVGIATGLVVVGDVIGAGASREEAVVGDTPNLAARLQSLAEPNKVMIAASTHRLTGGLFEYRALNAVTVRGYDAPIQAWQVVGEAAIDSRFEALRSGGARVGLFGRDEELALLSRRWEQAREGAGRAVLLSGEAGIGKSRLTAALEDRLQNEPHLRLRWFCAPHFQDSALHPIISVFTRRAGFAPEDDGPTRLAKLQALLAHGGATDEDVALIADLLSLPVPADHRLTELTPQRRKERSFTAILRQLEHLARTQPLLAVFEDLHWADPTSLELLDRVVAFIEHLPMLLVVTSRPDLQPSWAGLPHVSVVMLNRLGRQPAASLIDGVAAGRPLTDAVREEIIAHADGIPLFVEELTKTVLDSGPHGMDPRSTPLDLRPPVVVPSSLHASLMSRLDRLASVKDVAQMGAVMGREFSFETFLAAFRLPRELAAASLRALVDGDVMVQHGRPPNAVYGFKHALMQDAAYGSLLRERRRTLHLQVAETLEQDAAGAEPELLAYHFAEAGAADRAIDYHLQAAERAMARCAVAEMVSHLRRGLGLLAALPDGVTTRRRELALQTALGRGLIDQVGSASEEGHAAFIRARKLCLELDENEPLLPILYGLQVYHFTHAEPETVTRYAREILDLGARTGNLQATILGERVGGSAYLLLGRFAESRSAYENLLQLYESMGEAAVVRDSARDPFVAGCSFLGICLTVMGYPDQGQSVTLRGLAHAEKLEHAISVVFGLRRGCISAMLRRDVDSVRAKSTRLLEVSTDYETFLGGPEARFFQGWAALQDAPDPAMDAQVGEALDQLDNTKTWALLSFLMASAAELKGRHGDSDGARALLARAAELARLAGERWCLPEITRLQARFNTSDPAESEAMLREAITVARMQDAKLWELRAATDLARLLASRGETDAAGDLLAPVIDWFTEGLFRPDLTEARIVLQNLSRYAGEVEAQSAEGEGERVGTQIAFPPATAITSRPRTTSAPG